MQKQKAAIAFPKTGLMLIAARLWKSLKTSVFLVTTLKMRCISCAIIATYNSQESRKAYRRGASRDSIFVNNRICFVVILLYQIFDFDVRKGN